MRALVYVLAGDASRSVVRARQVAEVEIDATELEELLSDQGDFAAQHGGDFVEIEDLVGAR
jgi:hypothetical protein